MSIRCLYKAQGLRTMGTIPAAVVGISMLAFGPVAAGDSRPFRGERVVVSPAVATRIEAENFDLGGEGVAYHEKTPGNWGRCYRMDENVDLKRIMKEPGALCVCWTEEEEWINYSIKVVKAGKYRVRMRVSRPPNDTAGKIRLVASGTSEEYVVYGYGGVNRFEESDAGVINLVAGEQVLRVEFVTSGTSIDWMQLDPVNPTGDIAAVACSTENLALNKTITSNPASSNVSATLVGGASSTRQADLEWMQVDLSGAQSVGRVVLKWGNVRASAFKVQTSADGQMWMDQYLTRAGDGALDVIYFPSVVARYVRLQGLGQNPNFTPCEIEVYER